MSVLLGIDTGGTYTDSVLYDEETGSILASAKSLTTHQNLAKGIGSAIELVLERGDFHPSRIALVGLSTTLATNALTEGRGGAVALISVGFDDSANSRPEIAEALIDGPSIAVSGGHNADGSEAAALDLDAVLRFVSGTKRNTDAYAVVSQFSVRNPSHELAVAQAISEISESPVTVSHELSPALGGPRRAATTILNARLMALIEDLLGAVRSTMSRFTIRAPLMIVRGDGSMLSDVATSRAPIETILSGPAASVIGAAHLMGSTTALVADIGGTTTDVAIMTKGRPKMATLGAKVGGQQTLIEAIEVTTIGLGGDSEVAPIETGPQAGRLVVGPKRIVPISLLAQDHHDLVVTTLERQSTSWARGENYGRFVVATGNEPTRSLSRPERYVWDALAKGPVAMDTALSSGTFRLGVSKLEDSGLVRRSGFTPTDAAHVLGIHDEFDGAVARSLAALLLEIWTKRRFGPWASIEELSLEAMRAVTRQSAELFLSLCLEADGLGESEIVTKPLLRAALDRTSGLTSPSISINLPIIGLGASAAVYHAPVGELLGTEVIVPPEAGVANAIGAVVGHVRTKLIGTISQPTRGTYVIHGVPVNDHFRDVERAKDRLANELILMVKKKADLSGSVGSEPTVTWSEKVVDLDGKPYLVEAHLTVESTGRPRLAHPGYGTG